MGRVYGIICRDGLCWHIGPLLSVRHFERPIAVPIADLILVRSAFFNVVAELAEWS